MENRVALILIIIVCIFNTVLLVVDYIRTINSHKKLMEKYRLEKEDNGKGSYNYSDYKKGELYSKRKGG
jgi:hypothetical protein